MGRFTLRVEASSRAVDARAPGVSERHHHHPRPGRLRIPLVAQIAQRRVRAIIALGAAFVAVLRTWNTWLRVHQGLAQSPWTSRTGAFGVLTVYSLDKPSNVPAPRPGQSAELPCRSGNGQLLAQLEAK